MTHKFIPPHLRQYIVNQEYDKYSAIDHAVWRFIMRISISFFKEHAHDTYLHGLEKTGISINKIPLIDDMDYKLSNFGWGAVCVKGFLPPAAFMELQSLGILPIAADMRTLSHLTYTPAPDIVHEAAGHAPILANQEYADYLKKYGEVANKAISSDKDMEVYYAIRDLSDIKESPSATDVEINAAEKRLKVAINNVSYVSEAAYLARMNWWTVEYGLIGSISNYKIYGAGLLSSVGESQSCLSDKVDKIPFSLDCINKSYDITEPQPQLYVVSDFNVLSDALEKIKKQMAFYLGGKVGLNKAIDSNTVCTVELDSKIQISGIVSKYIENNESIAYIMFTGPSQLARYDIQLDGHGGEYHTNGYGTAIGKIKTLNKSIYDFNDDDIQKLNLYEGNNASILFDSGVVVKGIIDSLMEKNGRILMISFSSCTVKYNDVVLFDPSWGIYDMVCGQEVDSVYGGPADFESFSEFMPDNTIKAINHIYDIPKDEDNVLLEAIYKKVNDMLCSNTFDKNKIELIIKEIDGKFRDDWLLKMNVLELSISNNYPTNGLIDEISSLIDDSELGQVINRGLSLLIS